MEKNIQAQQGLHGLAALSFERLIRLKEKNDRAEFDKLIQEIMPAVSGYIARRLSTSVRNGHLPSGKYKVQDFTDELYLKAFEHIEEVGNDKDLYPWLFKKADELLEDTIVEEEFSETFLRISTPIPKKNGAACRKVSAPMAMAT